ncbi:MFS transporter [Novosphingobium sp.]|uniref:MFS transporter n=1 Tax=Novosphingobium sp. TaxID=1874826 RepID=UPI0031D595B3
MHDTVKLRPTLREALEEGPFTAFQIRCALIAVLAVVLDGFDIQLLGVAMPSLMKAWGVDKAAFVPVIAGGLLAMSLATTVSGWLGDRIGRRPCLIGALVIFGLGTLGATFATSLPLFFAARLVASLGMGGAMPVAIAILAEYTPRRHRGLTVTASMVCMPLGGMLAGVVAAQLVPLFGWPSLFVVGGVAPLAFAVILLFGLPESAHYLRAKGRVADLEKLADRLGARVVPAAVEAGVADSKGQFAALFADGLGTTTLLIWGLFLAGLLAAYTCFNWLPTLLTRGGQSIATGSLALAAFNFGGILGTALGALLIGRLGSKATITGFALAGTAAAVASIAVVGATQEAHVVEAAMALTGFCLVGVQTMLFALASHAYPDHLRATGVGVALGVGRLGGLASSAVGAVLVGQGYGGFFGFLAVLMAAVGLFLLMLRPHIPSARHQGESA